MKLAIISDTHDEEERTKRALRKINAISPDKVVHCGDLTSAKMLSLFKGLDIVQVLGNCDSGPSLNHEAVKLGLNPIDYTAEFKLADKSFFVAHGNNANTVRHAISSQAFDFVLHGHTHVANDETFDKTRIVCPGALHSANFYSFAVIDLSNDEVEFITIE